MQLFSKGGIKGQFNVKLFFTPRKHVQQDIDMCHIEDNKPASDCRKFFLGGDCDGTSGVRRQTETQRECVCVCSGGTQEIFTHIFPLEKFAPTKFGPCQ